MVKRKNTQQNRYKSQYLNMMTYTKIKKKF